MDNTKDILDPRIDSRISLLKEFGSLARQWGEGKFDPDGRQELRERINKLLIPARLAVLEAGTMQLVTISPPPSVGGILAQNIDPFRNFFENFWGKSLIRSVIDAVDQAIGVYEYATNDSELVSMERKEALDIETAIYRALRPSFRNTAPTKEIEVQDAIENILNALGINFVRDKEVVVTGPRASKPDFTVEVMELAIEVKLAKDGHGASKIQEEMNADITAYKQKWKRLMFIIYDIGVIDDPHRMIRDNKHLFDISVLVVKH